jgi:peptide/nickel transport system substrate-binding protein
LLRIIAAGAAAMPSFGAFASEPVRGGTLNVGFKDDAKTLDPIYSVVWSERQILFLIYDSLLNIGTDFSIKPGLAESWRFENDNKRLVLKLVAGIKFHDGTIFDAEAVKWNLDRRMDPSANSPQRSQLEPVVASVSAVDGLTVAIDLKDPFPPILSLLTDRIGLMVSPTAAKAAGEDFGGKPVGTGPFVFTSWTRGSRVEVRKNPDFWQNGVPYLDGVILQDVSAAVVGIQRMKTGEIDFIAELSPQNVRLVQNESDIRTMKVPVSNWFTLQWHWNEKPFNDPKLRLAVAHAVNRDRINAIIWGGQGTVADSETPAGLWWSPANTPRYTYDPQLAKKLFEESEYEKGKPVKLSAPSDPLLRQLVQLVKEDLDAIGFVVDLEPIAQSEWYPRVFSRQINFTPIRWTQRADPDSLLQILFHSKGTANTTGYNNPEVDALIDQARKIADPSVRKPLYDKVHEIVFTDQPYVSLIFSGEFIAMRNSVQGYVSMPDLIPRFRDIWKSK